MQNQPQDTKKEAPKKFIGFYKANPVIINVAPGATLNINAAPQMQSLDALPPADDKDPRSPAQTPRPSVIEVQVKVPKKFCGLC